MLMIVKSFKTILIFGIVIGLNVRRFQRKPKPHLHLNPLSKVSLCLSLGCVVNCLKKKTCYKSGFECNAQNHGPT